jgi:hypothetical protein
MVIRKDRPDGRKYFDGEGNEYWSVTTLLSGGVPKQNLIPWAAAQASHSMVEELAIPAQATRQLLIDIKEAENSADIQEAVWERLEKALTNYNDRDIVLGQLASGVKTHVEKGRKFVSNAHKRTRDAAADAGTEAHKAIERHILGEPVGELGELAQASFENFLEFEKQLEPRWEASELTVFNPTAKYAGTLDFIAEIPALGEGLTLGDIKTGKGVYLEVALQLAAYRFAEFATTAHNNEKVEMPKTERAVVLHLRPDSWELVPVQADTEAFQMFLHVSNVAWFTRRGNGDSWILPAEYFGTQEAEDAQN